MRIQNSSQGIDRDAKIEDEVDEFNSVSEEGLDSAAKMKKRVEPPSFKIPKKVDICHAVATVQDGQNMPEEEEEDVGTSQVQQKHSRVVQTYRKYISEN